MLGTIKTKAYKFAPVALLLGGFALSGFSCTEDQIQEAQAVVAGVCAGAQAGAVLIAADGTILGASTKTQTQIAAGQQLVQVNCTAIGPAITAVSNAMKTNTATALIEANTQASKLHIPALLLGKIASRYAK